MRLVFQQIRFGLFLLATSGLSAERIAVHISPDGDDRNPGTIEKPLKTLVQLQPKIGHAIVKEVVFHGGVYRGTLEVRNASNVDINNPPPILIRAAKGEEVILDGGMRLAEAEAVPKWPGVYLVRDVDKYVSRRQRNDGYLPQMWDAKARVRYRLAGGLRALRKFKATYWLAPDGLYIHTADDRPVKDQSLEISSLDGGNFGILVMRGNVTIRNLKFRNYFRETQKSAGVGTLDTRKGYMPRNILVEDCLTFNCPRGFASKAEDVTFRRCVAVDCGGGFHIRGSRNVIEDCTAVKHRDPFMVPIYAQEDTGVEIYYSAREKGIVRRNFCQGFVNGVFVKCYPGDYIIENNTVVNCRNGIWCSSSPRSLFVRNNLILGSEKPFGGVVYSDKEGLTYVPEGNGVWPGRFGEAGLYLEHLKRSNQKGKGNFMTGPEKELPEAMKSNPPLSAPAKAGLQTVDDRWPPTFWINNTESVFMMADLSGDGLRHYGAGGNEFSLRLIAEDTMSRLARMRYCIDEGEWTEPVDFREEPSLKLELREQPYRVQFKIADDKGNWSEPVACRVSRVNSQTVPRLAAEPKIRANPYGAIMTVETNTPCRARANVFIDGQEKPMRLVGVAELGSDGYHSRERILGFTLPEGRNGAKIRYQIILTDLADKQHQSKSGEIILDGDTRVFHVHPDRGRNTEGAGTKKNPFRTLQHAADRALPGDRIILQPGIYTQTALIGRGGSKGAPLVIESEEKWGAVFDGRFKDQMILHIAYAPYVELKGIEFRFYCSSKSLQAVKFFHSPGGAARECKIWNGFWQGSWSEGVAMDVVYSPGFVGERNLFFRNAQGFTLWYSPNSKIIHNTCVGQTYHGVLFADCVQGSVMRNNSLAFNGNDMVRIHVKDKKDLETFDSDYNNIGTTLRRWRDEPDVLPNVKPRERVLTGSKGLIRFHLKGVKRRIHTFEDWQKFSGKDKHSIFADPLYRSAANFIFELDPKSPNIGAGENGSTIGALGITKE